MWRVNLITVGRVNCGTRHVYHTDFSALAVNVNNNTCELHLPASTKGFTGGLGDLYFVYRRIYGELLLIFVLYFNCHSNQKKIIFKGASFPSPLLRGSVMYQWDSHLISFFFFFALHNSQAVYFLINQTRMMLYYCMHFNFFFPG